MIRSFKSRDTQKLSGRERVKRFAPFMHRVGLRKLRILHRATSLRDLRVPPSNRPEALKGDRAGQYSIRINDQFQICFKWKAGDAFEVEIVDYH